MSLYGIGTMDTSTSTVMDNDFSAVFFSKYNKILFVELPLTSSNLIDCTCMYAGLTMIVLPRNISPLASSVTVTPLTVLNESIEESSSKGANP